MDKVKKYSLNVVNFIIAVILSVWLLDEVGVDASNANIFNFEAFSFYVLILLGICIEAFNGVFCSLFRFLLPYEKEQHNKAIKQD
ncbi:hypothetical protein GCM10009111_23380 [Colwellia asteriadis]|uniref:Uncharacterized protein n=1 Tax=Colwellia asteriadis TaxID=517723 RepID=A0ABN1L8A8_9GAMM